jgi:glycerate kinase
MNVLIACDSFKDALDAASVCRAIERGLHASNTRFSTRIFPLADGGEGMSDILDFHLGLKTVGIIVYGPVFTKIQATYHLSTDGKIAFIEMAQAAGLQLLENKDRNPLKTTTFGVGEMIADAISRGAERIVLGLGGSATNDLGTGMAAALGWQFWDQNDELLAPIGENMPGIKRIVQPTIQQQNPLSNVQFEVMCDVTNPLLGEKGAAHVYARQKGADDAAVKLLEKGAENMVKIAAGIRPVNSAQAGAGAAGGLGFGAQFFLGAQMKRGIDAILDLTSFDQHVAWADVIFTGEGRLDSQTAQGKLIAGVVARCAQKRVIALCGAIEATPRDVQALGLTSAFSIAQKPCSLQEALWSTAENLEKTAFQVGQLLEAVPTPPPLSSSK